MDGRVYTDRKQIVPLLERRTFDIMMGVGRLTLNELLTKWEQAFKLQGLDKHSQDEDHEFFQMIVAKKALEVSVARLEDGHLDITPKALEALALWPDAYPHSAPILVDLYDPFVTQLARAIAHTPMKPAKVAALDELVRMRHRGIHVRPQGQLLMDAYYQHLCKGITCAKYIKPHPDTPRRWADTSRELDYHDTPCYLDVRELIMQACCSGIMANEASPDGINIEWLDSLPLLVNITPAHESTWALATARAIYKNTQHAPRGHCSITAELAQRSPALEPFTQAEHPESERAYNRAIYLIVCGMIRPNYRLDDRHHSALFEILQAQAPEEVSEYYAKRMARMICAEHNLNEINGFLFGRISKNGTAPRLADVLMCSPSFIKRMTTMLCATEESVPLYRLMCKIKAALETFRTQYPGEEYRFVDRCIRKLSERAGTGVKTAGWVGFVERFRKERKQG